MTIRGRVVIVTGAARGIGKAIAEEFGKAGACLFLIARSKDELKQVALYLARYECDVLAESYDIADPRQVDLAVEAGLKRFGRIDVLVNNAGIQGPIGPVEDLDFSECKRVVEVNLLATLRFIQKVIPGMKRHAWGRIINVSGGGGTGPLPRFCPYAASKAAIVRLTETVAQEVKAYGVTVNAIAPGNVKTRMTEQALSAGERAGTEYLEKLQESAKGGGVSPYLAAELAVILASDEAQPITGRLISAVWDDCRELVNRAEQIQATDIYTLRRILPKDRGFDW